MRRATAFGGSPPALAPAAERGSALAAGIRSAPAAVAVVCALLVVLAFDDGGYFPAAYATAAAVALGALAVLALGAPPGWLGRTAVVALGALGALAAWTAASRAWTPLPAMATLDMQRVLLYGALLALALLAAASPGGARALVWALLGVVVVVVGDGLAGHVRSDAAATRGPLGGALGYANAYGALAALGTVLALGLSAARLPRARRRVLAPRTVGVPVARAGVDPAGSLPAGAVGSPAAGRTARRVRVARTPRAAIANRAPRRVPAALAACACGLVVPLAAATALSDSRGAWAALVAGLVVLVALSPNRRRLVACAAIAAVPAGVAVLRVRTDPDPAAAELAALALTATFAHAVLSLRARRAQPAALRPIALAAVAALAAAAAGAIAARGADVARATNDAIGARSDAYRVALHGFAAQPLRGEGAGAFELRYARERRTATKLRDAHSLALETLAELGAAGLLALVTYVAAVLAGVRRALRGRGPLRRTEAAAVAAAFAVWLTHACIDWDWQMPALTGVAIALSGTLVGQGHRRRRR